MPANGNAEVTGNQRVPRRVWVILTASMGLLLLVESIVVIRIVAEPGGWRFGMDFAYYRSLGEAWLADGSFYSPRQLAGPYVAGLLDQAPVVDNLYPPLALVLFVPFATLPPLLWWVVPFAVCTFVIWGFKPAPWAWPVILACLLWPKSLGSIAFGNSDIWIAAFMAAGLRWGWPALLIPIKPSLLPFVIVGANQRSWWVGLCVLVVFVLATWPLWMDYARVITNATIPLAYSAPGVPLIVIPLVAWFARTRPEPRRDHADAPSLAR